MKRVVHWAAFLLYGVVVLALGAALVALVCAVLYGLAITFFKWWLFAIGTLAFGSIFWAFAYIDRHGPPWNPTTPLADDPSEDASDGAER